MSTWDTDRIDIFARGGDGRIYHNFWDDGGFGGWEGLDGSTMALTAPAAVSRAVNKIDVQFQGPSTSRGIHYITLGCGTVICDSQPR